MKRVAAGLVVLLMVVTMAPQAQAIAPFLSWWNPEYADDSFGVGLRQTAVRPAFLSVETRISWYSLDFPGDNANIFPIEAALLAKVAVVYGGVGGGFYPINRDLKDKFGYFGVVGVGIDFTKIGIFGELKYTVLETETKNLGAKIDLEGPAISVGVKIGG
jgi:hypothetical protein